MTEKYPRSWSQLSDWECPEAFRLKRLEKVWQRPAAWLAMGTGVHAAIELWERSDRTAPIEEAISEFDRVYTDEINEALEQAPNTDTWMWSGRYDGATDIDRRRGVGRTHVRNTFSYYATHPEQVPWVLPDGRKAVELDFDIELGSVTVRGVLDAVIDEPGKPLRPRDNKTGSKVGDPRQLKLTGIALEEFVEWTTGEPAEPVTEGDFFMTRDGSPKAFDLSAIPRDLLTEMFEALDAGVQAGDFPPNPSPDRCRRCSVNFTCRFRQD